MGVLREKLKERMTTRLRKEISKKEILVTVGCYNALTARIAEDLGFRAVTMQGWITGAHLGTTEPLTTLTEYVNAAKYITDAGDIILKSVKELNPNTGVMNIMKYKK